MYNTHRVAAFQQVESMVQRQLETIRQLIGDPGISPKAAGYLSDALGTIMIAGRQLERARKS